MKISKLINFSTQLKDDNTHFIVSNKYSFQIKYIGILYVLYLDIFFKMSWHSQ